MAVAEIIIAVIGLAAGAEENRKARRAREKASDIQEARDEFLAVQERRKEARRARARRAEVEAVSANIGASGSSLELGTLSAVSSREGGFSAGLEASRESASAISQQNEAAATAQFRSQLFQQAASTGIGISRSLDK
jgi:hypothetical protein